MVSGGMRYYTGRADIGPLFGSGREAETGEGVECASDFEGAYALEVFTFEIEAEDGR